jgi:predicted permease
MVSSRLITVPLDVRYGLRKLNKNVGFTAVAVACLALGICAAITVFSVVNSVLLRPLPGVADQDRLVSLIPKPTLMEGMGNELVSRPLSYPTFQSYREASQVFSGLVACRTVPVNLVVGGEALRLRGQVVTDNYFSTLGLKPALGRLFVPGEGLETLPEVVVSHALWQSAFVRRQRLGSVVNLNGHPFVVVGVAPRDFRGTQNEDDLDLWMPIEMTPLIRAGLSEDDLRNPERGWLYTFFGRLAPSVDLPLARREMDLLANRFADGRPRHKRLAELDLYAGLRVRPGTRGALASPLVLLSAIAGLLMLVVCANLGSLLLVKAAARQGEIGVRLALGVTRGQLLRQLLAESVTLSVAGGAAGLVLSLWTVDALQGLPLGQFLPRLKDLSMDVRVVAFTIAVSLGAGVLFGLIPALWSTRRHPVTLLHLGADNSALDRGRTRLQEMFVVGQVGVSLLLLVMTGLFVRTLWNLRSIDPGFDSSNILNLRLNLALQRYPQPAGMLFYDQILPQVRELRGVRSAGLVSWVPLSRGNELERFTTVRPRSGPRAGSKETWSQFSAIFPGYFRSLGIAILRGRDFSPADSEGSNPVVIVDETLAARLWPGRNPLGEQVDIGGPDGSEIREVVGIVRGVRPQRLEEPQPFFYLPFSQYYEPAMTLQVRTEGDPEQVLTAIRSSLRKLDPSVGVEVSRFDQEVEETLAQPRLLSWLLGSFSSAALLVTAIGIYGTLAYTVSRRTRELGIRMALGARSSEIVGLVLRRGLTLTLTGLVLGVIAASWATSIFSGLLFGVAPTDPAVFVSVSLLLTLVGLAASSLPAYSASRIDPMAIIRHE